MKAGILTRIAILALVLALGVPAAVAGKGGEKGKPGGGGGGGDPVPACSDWIYALWHQANQPVTGIGLARLCADGGGTELLSDETLSNGLWDRIEVSPDGGQVLNTGYGLMVDVSNAGTQRRFDGTDLPQGHFPTWSWLVDGAGTPLASAQQLVAAKRLGIYALPGPAEQHVDDIYAFHPVAGASATRITDFPKGLTEIQGLVWDPETSEYVNGTSLSFDAVGAKDLTWIAGGSEAPDISWIVYWYLHEVKAGDAIDDPAASGGVRYENIEVTLVAEGWYVQTVETSTDAFGETAITAVGSPEPLIPAEDEDDIDIIETNLRFSKFGTRAIYESSQGHMHAALTYVATDAYAPPRIDVASIELIDPAALNSLGGVVFANLALSRDGGQLAMGAQCEVWTMDLDLGGSSLERISARHRKGKACYGIALAWSD